MLVCTQCGFENPNSNNFCQECGVSLMHKTCPACGSSVPFSSLHCQACGTESGITWLAIVTLPASDFQLQPIAYLDEAQRYQLLDPFVPDLPQQELTVLDCQPLQISGLQALGEGELDDLIAAVHPEAGPQSAATAFPMPEMAQPYLALRSQFLQTFPVLHDAWQSPSGQAVVLLEERSHLRPLVEVCDSQTPPTAKTVINYLAELIELWDALTPWHCRQSLLDLDNLRIDGDDYLCLQRLDRDAVIPPPLAELGRIWQALFIQPALPLPAELITLMTDVEAGQLTSTDEVRSRFVEITPRVAPAATLPLPTTPGTDPDGESAGMTISAADLALMMDVEEEEGDGDELPTVVLPMQLFSLDDVGRSDTGRQREHNEDFYGIDVQLSKQESPKSTTLAARNLYILCDGMGGHARGEVASMMAVNTLRQYFKDHWLNYPPEDVQGKLPDATRMLEAVQLANQVLYDENQQDDRAGSGRMGTTMVLMLVQNTSVAIAHVGDSRLYRFTRKRGLEQITIDHEVGQREIQRGVDADIAYARPDAYQLTQALGPRDESFINPDVQYLDIAEDSLFLLCSDGMSDNDLLEKHCKSHIEPLLSSQTNLDTGVSQLMDLANEYNGHDNITAIVVRAKVRPNLTHLR